MAKDYIDITPQGVENGKGVKGLQNTVFQESELVQIRENPGLLTMEGIDEKIRIWARSVNAHVLIKYKTMKQQCKNVQSSGEQRILVSNDDKGKPVYERQTILAYGKDGKAKWVKPIIEETKKTIIKGE